MGYAEPIEALLAVATCLGDFTILNESGDTPLEPRLFVGDDGVGGVLDCCSGGKPILRVESTGELPSEGPVTLSKQGCLDLVMGIRVTFLTCFKTITNKGIVLTDVESLAYSRVIQDSRWRAIEMLRCCKDPNLKFVASAPVPSDGKCSGFTLTLATKLTLCRPCPSVASS